MFCYFTCVWCFFNLYLIIFYFFDFLLFHCSFIFLFFYFFVDFGFTFCCFFCFYCFPYFRGNSLISRADLEFKGFRFFPRLFRKKKKINIFFEKSSWKKKNPFGCFNRKIEFQPFFLKKNRGKKSKFLKFNVSPWI